VRIVCRHEATAEQLVRKLYRWLISETAEPGAALLEPLVTPLAAHWDLGRVIEKMLRSNLFFSPAAYRQRIKSPVEFAVGMLRAVEANVPTLRLANDLKDMGQDLYFPPTVRGWVGGRHWLNAATMVRRDNLAAALVAEKGAYGGKVDLAGLAERYGHRSARSAADFFTTLLLQDDLSADVPHAVLDNRPASGDDSLGGPLREIVYSLMTRPEYQLD